MKEHDPPIAVAKIDATSESALASRFGVSGYPTIKILKKGQAVDYEGSRTQEGEWYLSHQGSRARTLPRKVDCGQEKRPAEGTGRDP